MKIEIEIDIGTGLRSEGWTNLFQICPVWIIGGERAAPHGIPMQEYNVWKKSRDNWRLFSKGEK